MAEKSSSRPAKSKFRISNSSFFASIEPYPGAEEALREHSGVADAAVVGAPDERYEELPVAFVIAEDPAPKLVNLAVFRKKTVAADIKKASAEFDRAA